MNHEQIEDAFLDIETPEMSSEQFEVLQVMRRAFEDIQHMMAADSATIAQRDERIAQLEAERPKLVEVAANLMRNSIAYDLRKNNGHDFQPCAFMASSPTLEQVEARLREAGNG